jgi:protein gp37
VFVDPSSDLFHDKVPDSFLDVAFEAMSRSKATFGVLSKRSGRLRDYLRGRIISRNIWVGVTVESPAYTSRIEDLLQVNARVRWVSVEPLLGELSLASWLGPLDVNWVVAGPELGEHARPCPSEWMRKLRVECTMAKVPFFTKHILDGETIREYPDG